MITPRTPSVKLRCSYEGVDDNLTTSHKANYYEDAFAENGGLFPYMEKRL